MNIDNIQEFASRLVKISSRAASDNIEPVCNTAFGELESLELDPNYLYEYRRRANHNPKNLVGLSATITGAHANPKHLCFNACIDTAPFGDVRNWLSCDPTSGIISEDKLYGRGAADSKIAAAIFTHLLKDLKTNHFNEIGKVSLLLDADEHSGEFGGVKRFVELNDDIDGVWIGYPGNKSINIGARGYYRFTATIFGESAHTGSGKNKGKNAIYKSLKLIDIANKKNKNLEVDDEFRLRPKFTVTEIHAGTGFSIVPDSCEIYFDFRLTPKFDRKWAIGQFNSMASEANLRVQEGDYSIQEVGSWPAYSLDPSSRLVKCIQNAAQKYFQRDVYAINVGPSSIANYLYSQGIDATCGFGVEASGIHSNDEWCNLKDIGPVYNAYKDAVIDFFQ